MASFVENAPVASDFMETARSFGNYDLALSLADIIDNSISADASGIEINVEFDDNESSIQILDDGDGMTAYELHEAMRMASQNPKNERSKKDLGRFGLGLKTASFAQATCLTVITKKLGVVSGAEWDLDNIENWQMKVFDTEEILPKVQALKNQKSFTLVIWSKLSRLLEGYTIVEADFNQIIMDSCTELGLIFHRYLSGDIPDETKKIDIFLNGQTIQPQNPFLTDHPATQKLHQETEHIGGSSIKITPYILPHFSKLRPMDSEKLAGKEGYLRNQGFYVYRRYRLIIKGTWFRIIPHGELTKLARVMVDIPNSLDEEWKITVDKSEAQIPASVRKRLKQLTEKISLSSNKVYTGKGRKLNSSNIVAVWNEMRTKSLTKFVINRNHPIIKSFLDNADVANVKRYQNALSLIEDGLPINDIHRAISDHPEKVHQSYTDIEPILNIARDLIASEKERGTNISDIKLQLARVYPFNQFYDGLIEALEQEGNI